jgi:predicted ester cyclase
VPTDEGLLDINAPSGHCLPMSETRPGPSTRVETALAFLEAGFSGDNDECARLLGEGYVWIDHAQGVVAQTREELLRVAEEHAGWVDRVFEIERVIVSVEITVIAEGTLTQTHMGTWRSIPPTGVTVTTACCEIVGFDAQGRVISEAAYQDDLSIMRQLGVVDLSVTT